MFKSPTQKFVDPAPPTSSTSSGNIRARLDKDPVPISAGRTGGSLRALEFPSYVSSSTTGTTAATSKTGPSSSVKPNQTAREIRRSTQGIAPTSKSSRENLKHVSTSKSPTLAESNSTATPATMTRRAVNSMGRISESSAYGKSGHYYAPPNLSLKASKPSATGTNVSHPLDASKPRTFHTDRSLSARSINSPRMESEPSSTLSTAAVSPLGRKTSAYNLTSSFSAFKFSNTTATGSRNSSASPQPPKSEDELAPNQYPPKIMTKRLSLREHILEKISPRARNKKEFPNTTRLDEIPTATTGRDVPSKMDKIRREEDVGNAERRMSVDSYYNPARPTHGIMTSADDLGSSATSRRASVNTHVFVDRSHMTFDRAEPNSIRSSKTSVYTRRQSLHPEVDEILRMRVPKRSAVLKYLLNKQPATPRGLVGLQNLGNTCFMNSILQCIFATECLMGYLLSGDYKMDLNTKSPMKGQLALSFVSVVEEALKPANAASSGRVINPSRFKRQIDTWAPQFAGYSQQDAQEFLRFMLDGLHEDLNRVFMRPRFSYKDVDVDKLSDVDKARFSWHRYHASNCGLIFDLFGGQLQSTVTCHSCNYASITFDTFWDLSLPIPKASRDDAVSKCSLADCLAEFAAKEVLDELYRCDNCKTKVRASKRLQVYRCPEILVLHLKRFSFSRYSRDKVETNVNFPLRKLSLESIMSPTPGHDQIIYYDLFGISNHMGGLGGGHYISHTKNWDTGLWYEKNDSIVTQVDEGRIENGLGRSSYVLFFQKSRG
ncbi:Ubiquitin carboxyl-terminal hydrolase 21 [Chytriomyces hyalinus]|nr:Ubiquitin carboxyl-terminal hydrolase 21 [Chytriomyces hyalinus]